MEQIFFFITASVAVASALIVITNRKPMTSLLFLVLTFFCLAVIYVMLGAQFLAALQVIVYAGAIMVLFLFVVMLLDQSGPTTWDSSGILRKALGWAAAAGVLLITLTLLKGTLDMTSELNKDIGTVSAIGDALFTRFLLPFEIASVLLLAAIIGVVALVKRKPAESDSTEGGES